VKIAVGGMSSQVKGQKGWSIEDNLTLDGIQWAGDHTIKMGAKYKQIDLYASDAAQINPQFYYTWTTRTSRTASRTRRSS
jgi:hypothetical protein